MAEFFDSLTNSHIEFIRNQSIFFVSTAAHDGRVNLSPKGLDTFAVLSPSRVAYLDLGGSGNETHAHLVANGRITIMFCNFGNPALIYRIYGKGKPVLPNDPAWQELESSFKLLPGTRQIFDIAVDSAQTSCGWGVPIMEPVRERATLTDYHAKFGAQAWLKKMAGRTKSIDGLPTRPTTRYFGAKD